jgi:hypothetical protein
MSGICSGTIKHFFGLALFFSALSLAAQNAPFPMEAPFPGDAPFPQAEAVPADAPYLPDTEALPDTPETAVTPDSEYADPPEEPEEFTAPEVTLPSERESLPQRIGNTLYEYFSAPGETRRREPLRRFDWEWLALNIRVANNFIGAPDVLQETIKINVKELASRVGAEGMRFNVDMMFRSAMHFNGDTKGFGLFTGLDGRLDMAVPDTLFAILRGETQTSGTFSVSGAVFAEAGFHRYFDVNKWRVDIRPAWFIPLVYIPLSEVEFAFDTEDSLNLGSFGTATAYLPVNLNKSGAAMLNNFGGLDFSVAVEYALFPILDVGLDVVHIPFMPSRLSNKAQASIDGDILEDMSVIDIIQDPGSLSLQFDPDYALEAAEIYVTRPFSMNTWVLYRPFRTDLLGVKPHIGFTTNTPSGKTHFNMGLELELNVSRTFFFTLRSGLENGIWRHGAGIGLNLRVFQLNIDAALASQDYLASWQGRGLSVGTGIHVGF